MRTTYDNQLTIGNVDISEIKFDPKSRDELPKILKGLQHIFVTREIREEVFNLLEKIIPANVSKRKGRKGMDLWKILLLAVVRLGCNWDYDKLQDMANNHNSIREMLGHGRGDWQDKYYYELQTIKDNLRLITPEVLEQLNEIVVKAGHNLLGGKKKEELHASADSFPVKTNVSFPTDAKLLLDSLRVSMKMCALLSQVSGIPGWRKLNSNINLLKSKSLRTIRAKRSRGKSGEEKVQKAYQSLIDFGEIMIDKVESSIIAINQISNNSTVQCQINEIYEWLEKAKTQIDQINRRVFQGEKIPHQEKIFSVFEPHTRWISKGKAGVPVELGLPVAIIKDQHGLILSYQVMETEHDVDVCNPLTKKAKGKFPAILSCSYDKGFWSPENYKVISKILPVPVMPKKGKLNMTEKERQSSQEFVKMRKAHPAVESAIHGLNHSGLDRCPDSGLIGFTRYVGLAIFARNLQTVGNIIIEKEKKKARRKPRKKAV